MRMCLAVLKWSGALCSEDCTGMLQKIQGLIQYAPQKGLSPDHLTMMADNGEGQWKRFYLVFSGQLWIVCMCVWVYLKQTSDISASHFSPLSDESDVYHIHISLGKAELAEDLKLSLLSLCCQTGGQYSFPSGNPLLDLNTKSHCKSHSLSDSLFFFILNWILIFYSLPLIVFLIQLCPGFLTAPSKHSSYLSIPKGQLVLTSPFV